MAKPIKKVIGGQCSEPEYQLITAAIRAAGFKNTSAGVRAVLLAFSVTRTLTANDPLPEVADAAA